MQSILWYSTHEERKPMDGTKQGEMRGLDGEAERWPPRVMTDGF